MIVPPSDYGLPHKEWRPGQLQAIRDVLNIQPDTPMLLEAPTGSGKTAIARAIGKDHSVTALCRTKVLQQENYDRGYRFDALFGRGNYPCSLNPHLMGSECEYAEVGMNECPDADVCPYLQQKRVVMHSKVRALNYAYWFTARWPRKAHTEFVVCDEAHLLSDAVLGFCGATITEKDRVEWDLPPFPKLNSDSGSVLDTTDPTDKALEWLQRARTKLLNAYNKLNTQDKEDRGVLKRLRRCERLGLKVRATIDALRASAKDWYILSGPRTRKVGGTYHPAFICKPLTARHHAPHYFVNGWSTLMMSATIGNPKTFAEELGLPYHTEHFVPSAWKPDTRPVIIPRNTPKLGRSAKRKGPGAYDTQADIIANLVGGVPDTWSGVIHQTSIMESKALAARLSSRGLGERLWLPPQRASGGGVGTEAQMAAWQEHRLQVPNAIAIAWSWHTGVDLLDEQIDIVAKVPFPSLGDPYERARLGYDGKMYLQRTAWNLEQACGRTRRGRPQDYDTPDEMRGLVAVVDGNWVRCQKYLSQAFLDSVVEV